MVIEIDTANDTPEEIREKLTVAGQALEEKERAERRKSIAHLFGSVKWGEDALEYQKRMRDEWTRDDWS